MQVFKNVFSLVVVAQFACLVACSNGGSTSAFNPVESSGSNCEDANCNGGGNGGEDGPVRVIDPVSGDTIYVRDTVIFYPDTTLRWIGNSSLVITEISTLNLDWLDLDGDDPAWVEIYNRGDVSAQLKGYALVERLDNTAPKKWVFGDELIAAKSFRTVFLDKKSISTVVNVNDQKDEEGKTLHARTHTNWKLDKDGGTLYLIDPSNGVRDSASYPTLASGVSWGIVDGGIWKYFGNPTPERKNTEATAYESMAPSTNLDDIRSGFYNAATTFNPPSVENGVEVRCTQDGSTPTSSSPVFNSPLTISKNTMLRCAAYKSGTLTKEVITKSIFIGETVNMPVVSISVSPVFFQRNYIKVECHDPKNCPPNLYEEVEYPIHVDYFENGSSSNEPAFSIEAGISLMGNWSRTENKKSVAIVMREDYQDGWLHYPLFETRKGVNDKYKGFNLRNNGNRFVSDYLEDAMGGAILEGSGVDYQRSRQVVVFYNGEYYGIHDMRERFNKNYVETNYGIDANTVNFVKHIATSIKASNGTTDDYENLLSMVANSNFSGANNANYANVKNKMDVGNFADYMAAEIYSHNGDWPNNNVRAWKSPDHRWKFMVYDLDHGYDWVWAVDDFFNTNDDGTNMFDWIKQGGKHDEGCSSPNEKCFHTFYVKLINNPDFKRMFINRSAVMFNSYTNSANVTRVLNEMASTLHPDETDRDLKKFKQNDRYYSNTCGNGFSISGSCMKTWAEARDSRVISEYKSEFGLSDMITVSIKSSGKGTVLMEDMTLPGSTSQSTNFTGSFFGGNAMQLTAVPATGAVFTGWSDGATENPHTINPTNGTTITATFK